MRIFGKNGQSAALEFLTTYGWAFLVILLMVGALAWFGVLKVPGCKSDDCFQRQALVDAGLVCGGLTPVDDGLEYESIFFLRDLHALEDSAPVFVVRDGDTSLYDYRTDLFNGTRFLISVECHTPVLACATACKPSDDVRGCMCYRLVIRTYLNDSDLNIVGYDGPGTIYS